MSKAQYLGTGRRKNSVARVRLVPGTGVFTVNGRTLEEYIPFPHLHEVIKQPFAVTETLGQYDVLVNANGGGFNGQSGAIRHGCLLYTSPSPRDRTRSRMPSSA